MNESTVLYWTRILKVMIDRNRSDLSEHACQTVLDALENKVDARVLREIAFETATSLGRHEDRGSKIRFNNEALDTANRKLSMEQAPPISANATELPALQQPNPPRTRETGRRPVLRRA